jgi:hypothetical protein
MRKGGVGGANTKTGAKFEFDNDLPTFISKLNGYSVRENDKGGVRVSRWLVFYNDEEIGEIFQKDGLYRYFDEVGYDYRKVLSKKLLPDDSIFVINNNTVYIIEKKYQEVAGSVDEKPQTCHFKLLQYKKLFAPLNHKVQFMYLFNKEWWSKDEYRDMLAYIIEVGCQYYLDYIPLQELGLPVPEEG